MFSVIPINRGLLLSNLWEATLLYYWTSKHNASSV
jgi:hypothetical protein